MQALDRSPELMVPADACDTHMHVYEDGFPIAPTAKFPPIPASLDEYVAMRDRLGLRRAVIVQPTAYGFDNRCTLQAAARLGPSARAIVVIDEFSSEAELDRLSGCGVVGIRFHMLPGGLLSWDAMKRLAPLLAERNWVVQLQLNGRTLPEHVAFLRQLPGRLVIDHVGKFVDPVTPDHPSFRALLDLVAAGRTYVKLSAAYEISRTGPPHYADVSVMAKALAAAAPERMLWASNWPHPGLQPEQRPKDADLLDLLIDWAPDETTRRKILRDNPAELYGFS